jgi:hypothetical protein
MANHKYELDLNFSYFLDDRLWHIEDAEIDWKKKEIRVHITINDQFGTLSLFQSFKDNNFYEFVNSNAIDRIAFLKQNIDFESLEKQHNEIYQKTLKKYKNHNDFGDDDLSKEIADAEKFMDEIRMKLNIEKGGENMAKLPDVYEVYDIDGYGVLYIGGGRYAQSKDTLSTWLTSEDAESVQRVMQNGAEDEERFRMYFNSRFLSPDRDFYMIRKVDDELVRQKAKEYMNGKLNLTQQEIDMLYPETTMMPIVNALKDEAKGLKALSDAFEPLRENRGGKRMKDNEVAVRFYEGFISNEIITFKNGDKTIAGKRIKMPNDDPNDTRVRRSFVVRESQIGTDTKNPHMKYVYLNKTDKDGKEIEYRVVRKNYDPEKDKSEILEDTKMKAQGIADVFQADRDREYAEYKQGLAKTTDFSETNAPTEVIEDSEGMEK